MITLTKESCHLWQLTSRTFCNIEEAPRPQATKAKHQHNLYSRWSDDVHTFFIRYFMFDFILRQENFSVRYLQRISANRKLPPSTYSPKTNNVATIASHDRLEAFSLIIRLQTCRQMTFLYMSIHFLYHCLVCPLIFDGDTKVDSWLISCHNSPPFRLMHYLLMAVTCYGVPGRCRRCAVHGLVIWLSKMALS